MEITIRQAKPDDISFLAQIMIIAGRSGLERGLWDVVFPDSETERLEILKKILNTDIRSYFHYSCFLVAEADGIPAAALCGYDPAVNSTKNYIRALQEIGFQEEQMNSFYRKITPFMSCYPDTPKGMWIIECVATLPEHRNKGLVSRLLKEIISQGRDRGYKKCQITVQIGNVPAKQAYLKAGFKEVDQKQSAEYERDYRAPGLERLQVEL